MKAGSVTVLLTLLIAVAAGAKLPDSVTVNDSAKSGNLSLAQAVPLDPVSACIAGCSHGGATLQFCLERCAGILNIKIGGDYSACSKKVGPPLTACIKQAAQTMAKPVESTEVLQPNSSKRKVLQ